MSKEPEAKTATAVSEEKAIELSKSLVVKAVKVKLTAAHRHNGTDYPVGAELMVDTDAAAFIIDNKVGVESK